MLTSAPLKATDVAAERWDSFKEKGDTCVLIDSLEERGEVAGGSHPQFVISTMKQNGRSSQLLLRTYSIRTKLKAYV